MGDLLLLWLRSRLIVECGE